MDGKVSRNLRSANKRLLRFPLKLRLAEPVNSSEVGKPHIVLMVAAPRCFFTGTEHAIKSQTNNLVKA
jgi:hypothetical protein